ncbi:MAG: hypothetical protein IT383_28800 [Deltaproteobacteria bacterium]|nr:hypothetical protein [Deltaproteobacteria bacterium]
MDKPHWTDLIDVVRIATYLENDSAGTSLERVASAASFGSWAGDRASIFGWGAIEELWLAGLLRADLVTSDGPCSLPGFVPLRGRERNAYADHRDIAFNVNHWWGTHDEARAALGSLTPQFHPFRLFVLFELQRASEIGIAKRQLLSDIGGFEQLYPDAIARLKERFASDAFRERVREWNNLAALCVFLEGYSRWVMFEEPGFASVDEGDFTEWFRSYWREVESLLRGIGRDVVERLHQHLAEASRKVDANDDIQILLRLAAGRDRQVERDVRGHTGGAFTLRSMAECLRRAAERAFGVQLPEEDQAGRGYSGPQFKVDLYGTDRLIDASAGVHADWIKQRFYDPRTSVRLYVEGHTEAAAFAQVLGALADGHGVSVVNLRGQVREKNRIALEDTLCANSDEHVFSYFVIDGDRSENVSVIRRAARDDVFCGQFRISRPDFEFDNFTTDELADVAIELAADDLKRAGVDLDLTQAKLRAVLAGVTNAAEMETALHAELILAGARFKKGEAWGRALGRYTLQHPRRSDGEYRAFLAFARRATFGARAPFLRERKRVRVDPESGELIERTPESSAAED